MSAEQRDRRREQERRLGEVRTDQGAASGEHVKLTPEQEKARGRRNLVIALSIGAFMLLVFLITLAQLRAGVLERPL